MIWDEANKKLANNYKGANSVVNFKEEIMGFSARVRRPLLQTYRPVVALFVYTEFPLSPAICACSYV